MGPPDGTLWTYALAWTVFANRAVVAENPSTVAVIDGGSVPAGVEAIAAFCL